jgi:hypothetical protein
MQQGTSRRLTAAGAVLWGACALAAASAASDGPPALDVSGAWVFDVKTDRGSGRPTFVFTQEGKAIKGTYRGFFGEAPLEGTLEGREIKFSFKARSPLNPLVRVNITYAGTVDRKEETMSGTVDFEGQGSGTWTGKRKREEAKPAP